MKETIRKTFLSLRNRNYRLFSIGQTISNTGNWLTNIALTLLVLKITGSGFAIGIVSALQYGPILFLSTWSGAIADRSDKRRLLFWTQGFEMAQSAGLAVLAFMPHPPLYGLYVLAVVGGIVLSLDNPLRRSFVSEMVPKEDVPNAVVLYSTCVNVARILGPAIAGLLIVAFGFGWCFTLDAISYIAVFICLIMMRPNELYRQPKRPRTKGDVKESIRYIMSMPLLWINFVMIALIGTLAYNFNVTLPLFVTNSLHSNIGKFTLLYSVFSVGAVISALVVARRGLVKMTHIIFGATMLGATMLLLAMSPSVKVAIPIIFLVGLSSILYMTATTTMLQVESKQEMHGRLLGLQGVFLIGTGVIGGPLSGWLADTMGARAPIMFGGIVCLISALFAYFAMKRNAKN
jgi:MFS family permease